MEDFDGLLEVVNKITKDNGLLNKLYGIKRINGTIHGRISPDDEEVYWLPKSQLCTLHERLIDTWERC